MNTTPIKKVLNALLVTLVVPLTMHSASSSYVESKTKAPQEMESSFQLPPMMKLYGLQRYDGGNSFMDNNGRLVKRIHREIDGKKQEELQYFDHIVTSSTQDWDTAFEELELLYVLPNCPYAYATPATDANDEHEFIVVFYKLQEDTGKLLLTPDGKLIEITRQVYRRDPSTVEYGNPKQKEHYRVKTKAEVALLEEVRAWQKADPSRHLQMGRAEFTLGIEARLLGLSSFEDHAKVERFKKDLLLEFHENEPFNLSIEFSLPHNWAPQAINSYVLKMSEELLKSFPQYSVEVIYKESLKIVGKTLLGTPDDFDRFASSVAIPKNRSGEKCTKMHTILREQDGSAIISFVPEWYDANNPFIKNLKFDLIQITKK